MQDMQRQLDELKRQQQVRVQVDMPMQNERPQRTVWDDITAELNSMSDSQKQILFADADYQIADRAIAEIASRYQMQILMPYVAADEDGKRMLEQQLHLIKAKKEGIIKREAQELEEFRRWKEQQARIAKQ